MKKIHIGIGVHDVARTIEDYTKRFGAIPQVIVPNEYALWRTDSVNFSIRKDEAHAGKLRHFGWEDEDARHFTEDRDVNGITWENFSAEQQKDEIKKHWPDAKLR